MATNQLSAFTPGCLVKGFCGVIAYGSLHTPWSHVAKTMTWPTGPISRGLKGEVTPP